MTRRTHARATRGLVALVFAAAAVAGGGAASAADARAGHPPAGPQPAAAGDEVVTGASDTTGYHLYAASARNGWEWHPLATLQPAGYEDERWIGQQCMTGDGRYVVAVVAPWHDNNSEEGMNEGGLAYAVNAQTGRVTPLAARVSLAYFDPGCGTGGTVALTSYRGGNQRPTTIAVMDPARSRVVRSVTVAEELTSAIPAGGRVLAAAGGNLVDVTTGHPRVLAHLPGQLFDLRASAGGGVDLLAAHRAGSEIWHWSTGGARPEGSGPLQGTGLFAGRGGHNFVVGATTLSAGASLRRAAAAPGTTLAVSLDGGLSVGEPAGRPHGTAQAIAREITEVRPGIRGVASLELPPAAPRRVEALPPVPGNTRSAAAVTSPPACAIPRNDIFKQALQPTSAQVQWAVNQAVNNWLSASAGAAARPVDNQEYENNDGSSPFVPLSRSYPSTDFPAPVSGWPGAIVPPLVMYGILAQESNWDQASWHAVMGRAGDPLISNYYGDDASANSIDYSKADCGYGIGQVTDLMKASVPGSPSDFQVRIATDYATNIAAAASTLSDKWFELHNGVPVAITMNNDDPADLENWYAAIWAYNSGVHEGDSGGWGLGWFNNPANPLYSPSRHTFLHMGYMETYSDAAAPQQWPYQEKVFGWMEVPLLDPAGNARYAATYDWNGKSGRFLVYPGYGAFCDPSNNCDDTQSNPCPADSSACWWDKPVKWADCGQGDCTGVTVSGHPGDPEPPPAPINVPCSPPSPGAGAVIVNDEALADQNPTGRTPNLQGCSPVSQDIVAPAASNASFSLQDENGNAIDAAATPSSVAAIDLHQLGGGLGGHMFFTHTRPASDGAREVEGVWSATLPAGQVYEIKAFVPDIGASAGHATYMINPGGILGYEGGLLGHTIDQNSYTNQWASLGYYLSNGRITVTLRTITPDDDSTQGSDVAFDAIAFVPVPAGGYVAAGDSYSSGEGLEGGWDEGTDVTQNVPGDNGNLCHRSAGAYPRLYAAAKGIPVVDLACSGSNLWDLAGIEYWWDQSNGTIQNDGSVYYNPANPGGEPTGWTSSGASPENGGSNFFDEPTYQTDLIRALKPRLVTLTIGGNDVGFTDIVHNCLADALNPFSSTTCQEQYQQNTGTAAMDEIDNRIRTLEYPVTDALVNVINAVGGDPSKVVLLTYPAPIKYDSGNSGSTTDCTFLFNSDRQWLLQKLSELDTMLTVAAQTASAQVDPSGAKKIKVVNERDAFNLHEACTNKPYVTPPDSLLWTSLPTLWANTSRRDNYFHPNAAGYAKLESGLALAVPNP